MPPLKRGHFYFVVLLGKPGISTLTCVPLGVLRSKTLVKVVLLGKPGISTLTCVPLGVLRSKTLVKVVLLGKPAAIHIKRGAGNVTCFFRSQEYNHG